MAVLRPFRAVRPVRGQAEKIAALPYDVYNREEAADALAAKVRQHSAQARDVSIRRKQLVDAVEGGAYLQARRNGRAFTAKSSTISGMQVGSGELRTYWGHGRADPGIALHEAWLYFCVLSGPAPSGGGIVSPPPGINASA